VTTEGGLEKFNTSSKQIISKKTQDGADVMKNLFAGEDENEVMHQFEQEKQQEIENHLGT